MQLEFRNFRELGEAIARLTDEEKEAPVCIAVNDVKKITLGTISFATEDWPLFESGDTVDEGCPYMW